MWVILLRLNTRKRMLVRSVLILSLISLASIFFLFLPQLVSPPILMKYLNNYVNGQINDIENSAINSTDYHPKYDFTFNFQTNTLEIINSYSSILEGVSKDVWGMFDPLSYSLHAETEGILNLTQECYLLCINDTLFETIYTNCTPNINPLSDQDILLLNLEDSANFTAEQYPIILNGESENLTITYVVNSEQFQIYKPYLNVYLKNDNYKIAILFRTIAYEILWQKTHGISEPYQFESYNIFTDYQKAFIYWSQDSVSLIEKFKSQLNMKFQEIDSSIDLSFSFNYLYEENIFLVEYLYVFVRGLQLIVWGISLFILLRTINKLQKVNKDQELREILAGWTWKKRLSALFLDSFLITITSLVISSLLFYPLMLFQRLLDISLSLDNDILIGGSILVSIQLLLTFFVFLDYEIYLRQIVIGKQTISNKYKPLMSIPLYGKILLSLPIITLLWVFNRNYNLLYLVILLVAAIIICLLVVIIIRLILRGIIAITKLIQKKRNKAVSKTFILFEFWKKFITSKFLYYSFILSLILTGFMFSSLFLDSIKSDNEWWMGSEVRFNTSYNNITTLENNLDLNPKIIDYTKIIKQSWGNQTILKTHYSGNDPISYGINISDYFNYFTSWNKKHWLASGNLNDLNESTVIVSKKFEDHGFKLGDTIELVDDTQLIIVGFIDKWPTVTDKNGDRSINSLILITSFDTLKQVFDYSFIYYDIVYYLHAKVQNVEVITNSLLNLDGIYFDEFSTIDPLVYEGLKRTIIYPVILLFEVVIFLWLSSFIFSKIDDIISRPEVLTLGIIAMSNNYKKPMLNIKLIELLIYTIIFTTISVIMFVIFYIIISALFDISFMLSAQTYINLIILITIYLAMLVIQMIADIISYRNINLSLIYRYPE
ncbi:MAG TPA: hypothetical protein VMZ29_01310 [Candidatus Bathyarchaeia archaeon]|nr:hypothetical protein [Candidatus Bathyarchaeia archaeon]